MSPKRVIRPIEQGSSKPVLLQTYDEATGKAVASNLSSPLTVQDVNFYLEVAKGNVPGYKMYSIPGKKDSLSTTVLDDLSEVPATTVLPVPGGIRLELVSSVDADSGAGGSNPASTGIRSIEIHYLDTAGLEQSETVVLDGTAPIDTLADNINNIQWMHAKTVGTGGVAAGNISLRNTAGAITYEYIVAGGNQSLSARYTVPANKTGYVLGWQVSAADFAVDFRLRATVERFGRTLLLGIFLFQDVVQIDQSASGWIPFDVPIRMPASATIKISALSKASGGDGGGGFEILLIDD